PVGAVLGTIDGKGAGAAKPAARAPAAAPAPAAPAAAAAAKSKAASAPPRDLAEADTPLSPAVRKLIAENQLDVRQIPASGRHGRLTKEDGVRFLEDRTAAASTGEALPAPAVQEPLAPRPGPVTRPPAHGLPGPHEERVRMSRLRKRIAERLKEAQNTAAI